MDTEEKSGYCLVCYNLDPNNLEARKDLEEPYMNPYTFWRNSFDLEWSVTRGCDICSIIHEGILSLIEQTWFPRSVAIEPGKHFQIAFLVKENKPLQVIVSLPLSHPLRSAQIEDPNFRIVLEFFSTRG
jgi:hypothetical protein